MYPREFLADLYGREYFSTPLFINIEIRKRL